MKIQRFLPFLLVLGACSAETAEEPATGTDSAAATSSSPKSGWEPAPDGTPVPDALADADFPPINKQEPRGGRIVQAQQTARQPEFRFETDAIKDAELKEFYLEMDATIDGQPIGTMTFVLWGDEAPITVRNYLRYADEGYYDGKIFHRIVRDFMLQGGSSNNTASGQGPYPKIKAEFSREPERRHRYGVLSMARSTSPDSASSQFFIITDSNSPSVKNLDGQYASFGIMVDGVAVLEQLADIPTVSNGREKSRPTQRAAITEVRVKRGTPSVPGEEIERPPVDLKGEPERVRIQHVLISFKGTRTQATRTKEEAEALAAEVLQRAKDGEDFDSLIMEYTDDPMSKSSTPPGTYSMLNRSQYPPERTTEQEAEIEELNKQMEAHLNDLRAKVNAGTMTIDVAQKELQSHPAMAELQKYSWTPREELVPGFGNVGFKLKVGEVGMADYHATDSPFGWHIIRRYE